MNKIIYILLALFYVFLAGFCFLLALILSGLHISDETLILSICAWVLFCISCTWLYTFYGLAFMHRLRKPVKTESERLERCMEEVLQIAQCKKRLRIRIIDDININAGTVGYNIIAISRGMIAFCTEEEMSGILAHELGHILHGDTIINVATIIASWPTRIARYVLAYFRMALRAGIVLCGRLAATVNIALGIAGLLLMAYVVGRAHLYQPLLALIGYVLVFTALDRAFLILFLICARFSEYRQDAFAQRLGYGPALCGALKKIELQTMRHQGGFSFFRSRHPMTFNRIRRLEELERNCPPSQNLPDRRA